MSTIMNTYSRYPVTFEHGVGCRLWDSEGKVYFDFLSGIGVNNLGHAHPKVVQAICAQAGKLIHTSNLYRIANQEELADRLTATCFAEQVFFCNSGAEANEAAIKLARKYMQDQGSRQRFAIITMQNSFHGRTMATLSATGQEKVKIGFAPLLPGFYHVPYGDIDAVTSLLANPEIGPTIAAIMLEPIQGESGVRIPPEGYLEKLRALADQQALLLIFDEVQSGMGRCGKMWCHQHSLATPDIMTSAKALASGIPMGACLATAKVAASFGKGAHASTFGGNPLASAAALATLQILLDDHVLDCSLALGQHLLSCLQDIKSKRKIVKELRIRGMMAGLELFSNADEAVNICLQRGLIVNCAMGFTIRILPPLITTPDELDEGIQILDSVLCDLF